MQHALHSLLYLVAQVGEIIVEIKPMQARKLFMKVTLYVPELQPAHR